MRGQLESFLESFEGEKLFLIMHYFQQLSF